MTLRKPIPLFLIATFTVMSVLIGAAASHIVIPSAFPQTFSSAQDIADSAQQETDSSSSSAADDDTQTNTNTQSFDLDLEQEVEADVENEAEQAADNLAVQDRAAVRSSDIVDGQVTNADLADDAVTSDKIRNGEVKAEDLDPSIELGDSSGALDVHIVQGDGILLGPGIVGDDTVDCPPGEILTGGGFESDLGSTMIVFDNHPADANTWFVQGYNGRTDATDRLIAYGLCVGPSS